MTPECGRKFRARGRASVTHPPLCVAGRVIMPLPVEKRMVLLSKGDDLSPFNVA